MPPRYAYWTILIDGTATAFRAKERDELLPTLNQLKRKNGDVALRYFAQGKLWDSPEQADWARRNQGELRERRSAAWRPGGTHADPKSRVRDGKGRGARDRKRDERPTRERRSREATPSDRPSPETRPSPPARTEPWQPPAVGEAAASRPPAREAWSRGREPRTQDSEDQSRAWRAPERPEFANQDRHDRGAKSRDAGERYGTPRGSHSRDSHGSGFRPRDSRWRDSSTSDTRRESPGDRRPPPGAPRERRDLPSGERPPAGQHRAKPYAGGRDGGAPRFAPRDSAPRPAAPRDVPSRDATAAKTWSPPAYESKRDSRRDGSKGGWTRGQDDRARSRPPHFGSDSRDGRGRPGPREGSWSGNSRGQSGERGGFGRKPPDTGFGAQSKGAPASHGRRPFEKRPFDKRPTGPGDGRRDNWRGPGAPGGDRQAFARDSRPAGEGDRRPPRDRDAAHRRDHWSKGEQRPPGRDQWSGKPDWHNRRDAKQASHGGGEFRRPGRGFDRGPATGSGERQRGAVKPSPPHEPRRDKPRGDSSDE